MSKVVVIGGGFGGIASALRIKAKGYQVTLIDRCSELGGRAQVFKRNGFTFDAGPTVITAPYLFDELFDLFDKDLNDYIQFVPVEPWYRFVFPDGDKFDYGGTLDDTLNEIEKISPSDIEGYKKLLSMSEKIFDVGFTGLADKPFHSFITMIKQVPHLVRLRCYRSVYQLVSKYLKHDKLRQAFTIQPLLVGGNPFDTTSIYNLIHFLERKWGIHYAMGGTGQVVRGLQQLMTEQGIEVRLDTTAESFHLDGRHIKGICLAGGEVLECDKVVSNMDPTFLYEKVIEKKSQPLFTQLKTRYAKLSMGLYVLYFGTNKKFHDVPHHTIWLGKRYQALLDDIFNKKVLADDFSLYLHRPSATDPSMAPDGCDCFYVLSPVPNLQSGLEWNDIRDSYRDKILTALDQTMMPGLKASIVEQFDMTPKEFQKDYLSTAGAGFSIAPILRQSAWFRYHNQGEGLDNLYLVGAGTHPGAGLPGVLSSAKVLDHLVPSIG